MFAYCNNSPVLFYDPDGRYSHVYDDKTDDEALEGIVDAGGGGGGFANAYNPIDAGYSYHTDFTMATNSSLYYGGIYSCGVGTYGYTGGEKTEVHHVVEQCQRRKSGFSSADIQAESNKVRLPYAVHRRISGHYSSIQPYSDNMRVRDWLAGTSFEFQTNYGWYVISRYKE